MISSSALCTHLFDLLQAGIITHAPSITLVLKHMSSVHL